METRVSFHEHALTLRAPGGVSEVCGWCLARVRSSDSRFACDACRLEFCCRCVRSLPAGRVTVPSAHEHPLYLCTTDSPWSCRACRKGKAGKERFRCSACDFDLCPSCVGEVGGASVMTTLHPHPVSPYDRDDGWRCDASETLDGCERGIKGRFQSFGVPRYRCHRCDYDLCEQDVLSHLRVPPPTRVILT